MNVGQRLRELRQRKNMSVYQLHQISSVSEAHIRNLERGSKNSSVETLQMLVESLGITMSEFFNADDGVSYLTKNEEVLLDCFRTLPADIANAVIEFCQKVNPSDTAV